MKGFSHPGFEVRGPLGSGAHAVVYLAQHLGLDRPVAIKVLREDSSEEMVTRLLREAQLIARLRHPHLVQVHDTGVLEDGRPYVVMECVPGATLLAQLGENKPPVVDALRIAWQIAGALGVAHEVGIVHRDVKPSNILMDTSMNGPWAKLADFGVARPSDSDFTEVGVAMGTPAYMAPECFQGKVEVQSDVYALGFMLYELLAGARPFVGANAAEWMFHHMQTPVPLLHGEHGVPKAVDALVQKMLAKEPADRFANGVEAQVAIGRLLDEPTLALPTREPSATMRIMPVGIAFAGMAMLALVASGLITGGAVALWWATSTPAATSAPPGSAAPEVPTEPLRVEVVEPVPAAADVAIPSAEAPPAPPPTAPVPSPTAPVPSPTAPSSAAAPMLSPPTDPTPSPSPSSVAVAMPSDAAGEDEEEVLAEPEEADVGTDEAPEAPVPEAPVAAPSMPNGTYAGLSGGRPITLVVAGSGSAPSATLTIKVGAIGEKHAMTGTAQPTGSGWRVRMADASGWALDAQLTDANVVGNFTINGRRKTSFEATK